MVNKNACSSCGDALGSLYHEVAHLTDVETAPIEELEAAAEFLPCPNCGLLVAGYVVRLLSCCPDCVN
tara:strand:- start:1669 stop:1872 length:204 start_codon:yes stop_codon:yes gene_type:complete